MTDELEPLSGTEIERRASFRDWVAVMAGTVGAMMAILDVSIVNAALPTIQGEIGATVTEGTWIATSFFIAEIIVIPMAAWLTRFLGMRTLLVSAASLFTVFSIICGLSSSLLMMIIGRIGQGLAGGVLIPTAFTIVATRLPPSQQSIGTAAFGSTAILGPIFGPITGGWLTDTWSWNYIFLINVPICIILIGVILFGFPRGHVRQGTLADADWLGIIGLALGLGCMTVVLEEGHRELWFESSMIVMLTIASVAGYILLGLGQKFSREPVLKLALLKRRAFGAVIVISIVFGLCLFGIIYIIPQFLAQIAGYTAGQAGAVLVMSTIPMMILMPFVPLLIRYVDVRLIMAIALAMLATSCFLDTLLTADTVGSDLLWSQVIRGLGQAMVFLFLSQAAMSAVDESDSADASSLFNTARNLGGSVGLALIAILQDKRATLHQARINETIVENGIETQNRLQDMAQQLDLGSGEGAARAVRGFNGQIMEQAYVMTYNDLFYVVGILVVLTIPLALILRPIRQGGGLLH